MPGEVTDLTCSHAGDVAGTTTISYSAPDDLGGVAVVYDVVRSSLAYEFLDSATCIASDHPDTSATDSDPPASQEVFYYLAVAEHACGSGPVGASSAGPRQSIRDCQGGGAS